MFPLTVPNTLCIRLPRCWYPSPAHGLTGFHCRPGMMKSIRRWTPDTVVNVLTVLALIQPSSWLAYRSLFVSRRRSSAVLNSPAWPEIPPKAKAFSSETCYILFWSKPQAYLALNDAISIVWLIVRSTFVGVVPCRQYGITARAKISHMKAHDSTAPFRFR